MKDCLAADLDMSAETNQNISEKKNLFLARTKKQLFPVQNDKPQMIHYQTH